MLQWFLLLQSTYKITAPTFFPTQHLEFSVQRTSTHVKIALMLIAILITISRMQNALPQSLPLILPVSKGPDLNEVRWGSELAPTHLPATYPLIPGIIALPFESMVGICRMIPVDLACPWVGMGGGAGRMCGLGQAAQTMSLVTSESSSWLFNLRSQNDDRRPECQSPCGPSDVSGLQMRDQENEQTHALSFVFCFSPQRMPSLRGRSRRRLESLFKNSLFWCHVKL